METYRQLLAKVDAKFEDIRRRHSAQFRCAAGCHGCCQPGLTVSPVERASIHAFLSANPARHETVEQLAKENPHAGQRCSFLTASGSCSIYEVRPVVCRSHGAPLKVKPLGSDASDVLLDVCPLNFEGTPLDSLGAADFIQLETLDTLLALINMEYAPEADAADRTPLSALLSPPSSVG